MPDKKKRIDDIIKKYSSELESKIHSSDGSNKDYSKDYSKFKQEMAPEFSGYEKLVKIFSGFVKIKISEKDKKEIGKQIEAAHLNIEPWQVSSFSISMFLICFFLGFLISISIALLRGSVLNFPLGFFFLFTIFSIFLFYFLRAYPKRLAKKWRLKASSQMVWAVLYIVIYMRNNSNLEKAISFASENLNPPLALDFKKIFYDVSIGKFSTIQESLDNYLESWREYSSEFIESFHLIESSLFEPDNTRRIDILNKSLQVILDGVYDKMLNFTHTIKSPLSNTYMLGVILPILGLTLLPLASVMLGGKLKWSHVLILYNLIIPFFVFYLTDKILMLRPGGQGNSSFLKRNPYFSEYKDKKVYIKAFFISFPFILIGLLPLIFQYTSFPTYLGLQKDYTFSELGLSFLSGSVFGFIKSGDSFSGPFGIVSTILSLFIPFGIALFFSTSFGLRTKNLIKEREKTKKLEDEFNNSLFQLGNRLGNGTPAELVFSNVAESSKGLITEDFFRKVNYNITEIGMSVDKAIFDKKQGAIRYYPSDLIAMSMKVLVESVKKGLKVAAMSLMSISEYIKNIKRINARLVDLLADIISDMKNNMTFLAPLLSGVVVGLAAMITTILGKINLGNLSKTPIAGLGSLGQIQDLFNLKDMIPPYYLQIAIGIYLVEIIYILTSVLVVVKSGEDSLERVNKTGINIKVGMSLYLLISFLSIVILSLLVNFVLGGLS